MNYLQMYYVAGVRVKLSILIEDTGHVGTIQQIVERKYVESRNVRIYIDVQTDISLDSLVKITNVESIK